MLSYLSYSLTVFNSWHYSVSAPSSWCTASVSYSRDTGSSLAPSHSCWGLCWTCSGTPSRSTSTHSSPSSSQTATHPPNRPTNACHWSSESQDLSWKRPLTACSWPQFAAIIQHWYLLSHLPSSYCLATFIPLAISYLIPGIDLTAAIPSEVPSASTWGFRSCPGPSGRSSSWGLNAG